MKKTTISTAMSIIMAVSAISPFTTNAEEKKDGYIYTIINNEATITGFEGEPTYLEIPETIERCRVTEIRDNAFYECGTLKHIDLPETIEKIGHHAFYACYSLETITIPDAVTEIGMGCFCGCEKLSAVTLSDSLKRLPDSCFRSCTSLTSFEITDNITEIGDFCFSGCTSLDTVTLGDSLEAMGDCAFYMCGLEFMYVPESVSELGVCSVGFTPTDSGASQIDGFTVLGKKKSPAYEYANENSLTFRNVDDSVQAFAIQRINGQRIAIPSIFLLVGGVAILVLSLVYIIKKKSISKN